MESVGQVNASSASFTSPLFAIVNVLRTVLAGVSRWAHACVVWSAIVKASGPVLASPMGTGVKLILTSNACIGV